MSALADITDPDTYVHGIPHDTFEHLRRHDPVSWWDEPEDATGRRGRGFWAVTRYDDLLAVSRDVVTYSSAHGIRLEEMSAEENAARRTMLELDPPEHTRYRRLVSKPFSRREVYAYEHAIRLLARSVVDEALREGAPREFDFVDVVAKQLPMRMLGRLLGVPDADGPWLVEQGDALLGNTDPEFTEHPVDLTDTDQFRLMPFRSPAGVRLFEYAQQQARQRRKHPTDDVISDLLRPMVGGELLTDREFNNFFTLLVAAGNDTTRYTMAAGIKALAERPLMLAELRDSIGRPGGTELMDAAVEEILRWSSVTMHFRRTATRDVEWRDRTILSGSGRVTHSSLPRPGTMLIERAR
jgi:cytochrome P450